MFFILQLNNIYFCNNHSCGSITRHVVSKLKETKIVACEKGDFNYQTTKCDFNLFLKVGNNSKLGDNYGRKTKDKDKGNTSPHLHCLRLGINYISMFLIYISQLNSTFKYVFKKLI
ncbi:hypothetical protein V6Z11_A12G162600 [Gossypium hirsutum]